MTTEENKFVKDHPMTTEENINFESFFYLILKLYVFLCFCSSNFLLMCATGPISCEVQ